jgi:hypothetical protein
MIFDKDRFAKLSGLMVESKDGSDKAKAKASDFGGGKLDKEQFLSGEVTTEGHGEEDGENVDEDSDMEEAAVREMIQAELSAAKEEMKEEMAVREAVRKELRSVLRSRGVTLGGTGFGFKR